MKVGDCIKRRVHMDDAHVCGIVIEFDSDNDPIIYWNSGIIEEEYAYMVEVVK